MNLQSEIIKGLEVQSDGNTVWVNGPEGCLARLCQISSDIRTKGGWIVSPCRDEGWKMFREDVLDRFDIEIPLAHKPEWT